MAQKDRGTPTQIKLMRRFCRFVRLYGTSGLAKRTSPAVAIAATALATACMAWEMLDDKPGEIDYTEPSGWEDDANNS